MIVRPAREGDVPALIEIERACFPAAEAAGAEQIRARFAAFPENFFVAGFRRQGVAAALLTRLIDAARARGCQGVVLTCKDHLKPYYEKFGFVCQGVSASTHGGATWNDMLLRF